MKITLYVIGHLKEAYWKSACEEYIKRLKNYADIKVVEVDDIGYKEGAGLAIETQVKDKEGEKVLEKLKPSDYLCALDLNAKEYDSVEFYVSFVIGGSLGLSDALKKRANERLSFSKMTFPHQMTRLILLEQLYRAFRIAHHEPYHK